MDAITFVQRVFRENYVSINSKPNHTQKEPAVAHNRLARLDTVSIQPHKKAPQINIHKAEKNAKLALALELDCAAERNQIYGEYLSRVLNYPNIQIEQWVHNDIRKTLGLPENADMERVIKACRKRGVAIPEP